MNKKVLILAGAICVPMAIKVALSHPNALTPHLKLDHAISASERIHGEPMVFGGIHTFRDWEAHENLYPGCDVQHAVFEPLDRQVMSYVSYTYHGKEHWTHEMRLIPKGEMIIQAGDCTILQRCGNEIRLQPPVSVMDEPIDPLDVYPPIPVTIGMPAVPFVDGITPTPQERVSTLNANSTTPPEMGPTLSTPLFVGSITPLTPVSVGEPSTLSMLFAGLVAIWGILTIPWRFK